MVGKLTAAPSALNPAYTRLKRRIVERTGHHYYEDKDDLLLDRLRRRMSETGTPSLEAYVRGLESGNGESEWQALEGAVTIGETFFFRYAEQFEALGGTILPDIIERNRTTRRLRIWSAGCSNGAEPYSVAILVSDLLGQALGDWSVRIVGTDISGPALERARTGRFTAWSLRTTPAGERARWFTESGDGFLLDPAFRRLVRFERHNLMTLAEGSSPLQFSGFDLILCRNVLIYFAPERVGPLVAGLRDALSAYGWLLLGHAEPRPEFGDLLDVVSLPGTTAYRRGPFRGPVASAKPEVSTRAAGGPWQPVVPGPIPSPSMQRAVADHPLPGPRTSVAVDEIRRLADDGDLAAAFDATQKAVGADPTDPLLHFYAGLIAAARGQAIEAEAAFRRTLYLDSGLALAHYHLGLLMHGTGRVAAGRRALATAVQLAAELPPDTELPEGDGLSAGRLHAVARLLLGRSEASR